MSGVLALFLLFLAAFLLNLGVPTKLTTWAGEVNAKKEALAQNSTPPRILLVGGSATLFGLSAREMETVTGVKSLNLASHAGLGTRILLNFAGNLARPGDVLVLALEYELYQSGYLNRESLNENNIDYVMARDPSFLLQMRPTELCWFFLLTPDKRLRRGLQNRFLSREGRGVKEVYNVASVNDWGDQVLWAGDKAKPPDQIANNSVLALGFSTMPAAFPLLQDFISGCAGRKIRLLAAYPNLMDRPKYRTETAKKTANKIREFYRAHGVEMAGPFEDSLLPAGDFFDTEYHLTTAASSRHTRLLATQMLPWLKKHGMVPSR